MSYNTIAQQFNLTYCGNDGSECNWPSNLPPQNVIYTANNKANFRNINGNSVLCSTQTFGDPAPGYTKSCYYRNVPNYTLDPTGIPIGYTKCANENELCTAPNNSDILYGADGSYVSGIALANTPVRCSNDVFGNPKEGSVKSCYIKPVDKCNGVNINAPDCINIQYSQSNGNNILSAQCKNSNNIYVPTSIDINKCLGQGCKIINNNGQLSCPSSNSSLNGQFITVQNNQGKTVPFYGWPSVDLTSQNYTNNISQTNSPSETSCAINCSNVPGCYLYNYDPNSNMCTLYGLAQNNTGTISKFIVNSN